MLAKPKWAWVIQRWPLMHQWEWLHDVVLCNSRGLDKWPSSSCIVCLNSNYFLTMGWSVCGFAQTIHSVIWTGLAKNRNCIEISQTARIFKKEKPPKRGWEKVSHAHLAAWWASAHLSHLGPLSGEKLGWVFCGLIEVWLNSWLRPSVSPGDDIPPRVKYLTALVVIHTGNKLFSFLQVDLITRLVSHGWTVTFFFLFSFCFFFFLPSNYLKYS